MRKYDYSFLKKDIPSNIVRLTSVIADLNARESFRKLQNMDSFESLRKKAMFDSVRGSNAIEGIITSEKRIKEIVNGALPISHDEKEISGYKDALNQIHNHYGSMDLNEETVLFLHAMMEGETNSIEAGKYKKNDNFIMEYDTTGNRRVRFTPCKASEVSESMEQLLLAFYDARQDSEVMPLLLIPCFILDFLCIHPFMDGNGRVSRLLSVLLLYRCDYDIVRYISFEGQVDKYKDAYYESLRVSSIDWHEQKNDYVPFIVNFLQILYHCYKDLDDSFMEISLKKAKKSERIENILMNSIVPISKQEIQNKLPDVSIKTIELSLSKLMKENKIVKIGTYKDARYKRS